MKERVFDEINRAFRPEFLNRLSEDPVIFRHLEKKDLKEVIELELGKIRERLGERGYKIELSNDAKEFIIKKGTNLDMGARPLRRALENFVEDPLAEELLQGRFEGKNLIKVDAVRETYTEDGVEKSKIKHLKFEGEYVEPPASEEPEEPVGVGAGETPNDDNGETDNETV